jgi:murein DD-endopeptidase MepM/ murein hydrolase activator NlpD
MAKWVMPVKGKFKYGPLFGVVDSWHPNGHRGTDYNGFPKGTPLLAVARGTIVMNQFSKVLGNIVVLRVQTLVKGEKKNVFFGYCHMDKPSPLAVGTVVNAGDQVGVAGTTGSASSGVHLHFTLSFDKDGVIGGKVYDADKFVKQKIKEEAAESAAPAPAASAAPVAPVVAETPAAPKVCETCKQEIK